MGRWREIGARRGRAAAAWAGVAVVAIAGAAAQRGAPAQRDPGATGDEPSAAPARDASMLRRIGRIDLPGAETICYDAPSNMILATGSRGVSMIHLGDGSTPTHVRTLSLVAEAEARSGMDCSITHVALRDGIGAACIVPSDNAGMQGYVALFSARSGRLLKTLGVGFNPDGASFSEDGRWLVVVNEGEPRVSASGLIVDPPGSISVIDVGGDATEAAIGALSQERVSTVGFGGAALRDALERTRVSDEALRIHPRNDGAAGLDLEPEYVVVRGGRAFVTMQENNAIGVFDLDAGRWERIRGLGSIRQRIDASDCDGAVRIDDVAIGLPMPDQAAHFEIEGRALMITANEGDDRGSADLASIQTVRDGVGDSARLEELDAAGLVSASVRTVQDLSGVGLGRLEVCAFSGDVDGDGRIERPTMLGTRSASVWDAVSLERVGDTGSAFEEWMAERAPDLFNASADDDGALGAADSRSDARGPEPEGVTVGRIGARTLAFVGLERPGAIAIVDVSDPASPRVRDVYVSAREGDFAPEGLLFIGAEESPIGAALLVVAYERSGSVCVYVIEDAAIGSPGRE